MILSLFRLLFCLIRNIYLHPVTISQQRYKNRLLNKTKTILKGDLYTRLYDDLKKDKKIKKNVDYCYLNKLPFPNMNELNQVNVHKNE